MRLSYISNSRIPTGHAHGLQIMYMCEEFAKRGAEVDLVVPAKKNFHDEDPFEHYGVERIFRITRITVPDLLSRISIAPRITFLLDLFFYGLALYLQPISERRIIYTRDYGLLFFLPRNVPIFLEVHDLPRWTSVFKFAARRVAGFVVITKGLKEMLIGLGITPAKILVAPDAVHLEDFANPESREAARRRLGLLQRAKIAMYIGRIDGWKGTDTLFEAASRMHDVSTVVIGALLKDITALRAAHPRITFFEMRPYQELADNQQAADFLILPASAKHAISARYTSPLKLFTYMTSGIPLIASDVPSLREVIDERHAFFFRADDAESLATTIEHAIGHSEEGREKARVAKELVRRYTWEERAKNILSFLRNQS